MIHDYANIPKIANSRAVTIYTQRILYDQPNVDPDNIPGAIVQCESYFNEYLIVHSQPVEKTTQVNSCPLFGGAYELAFADQMIIGSKCKYVRSMFIKDKSQKEGVYFIRKSVADSNDPLWKGKMDTRYCEFNVSMCSLISTG